MTTLRFDAVAGALSTALTAGQTTMYSDGLADMGTVASPDTASITLFISDSNGRVLSYEVVTVTAHTSGATSATITRNVESRNIPSGGWIIGTRWDHAATAADFSASSGLTSFQGRTTAAAVLTKADVTGTGLTYTDVGADASGAAATVQTNLTAEASARVSGDALAAQKANNLSDLANAATARTNLGLGTAATQASSAFDAAGAAATVQTNLTSEISRATTAEATKIDTAGTGLSKSGTTMALALTKALVTGTGLSYQDVQALGPVFNVVAYGALTSGLDTASATSNAVTSAMAAARAAIAGGSLGAVVYFPPGLFAFNTGLISRTTKADASISVVGAGGSLTVLLPNGSSGSVISTNMSDTNYWYQGSDAGFPYMNYQLRPIAPVVGFSIDMKNMTGGVGIQHGVGIGASYDVYVLNGTAQGCRAWQTINQVAGYFTEETKFGPNCGAENCYIGLEFDSNVGTNSFGYTFIENFRIRVLKAGQTGMVVRGSSGTGALLYNSHIVVRGNLTNTNAAATSLGTITSDPSSQTTITIGGGTAIAIGGSTTVTLSNGSNTITRTTAANTYYPAGSTSITFTSAVPAASSAYTALALLSGGNGHTYLGAPTTDIGGGSVSSIAIAGGLTQTVYDGQLVLISDCNAGSAPTEATPGATTLGAQVLAMVSGTNNSGATTLNVYPFTPKNLRGDTYTFNISSPKASPYQTVTVELVPAGIVVGWRGDGSSSDSSQIAGTIEWMAENGLSNSANVANLFVGAGCTFSGSGHLDFGTFNGGISANYGTFQWSGTMITPTTSAVKNGVYPYKNGLAINGGVVLPTTYSSSNYPSGAGIAGMYKADESDYGALIIYADSRQPTIYLTPSGPQTTTGRAIFYGNGNAVLGGGELSGVTDVSVTGLTGATAASRYVGATASGAPVSGTFAKGDHITDQTGLVWVCTAAGTPGTWAQVGISALTGDVTGTGPGSTATTVAKVNGVAISSGAAILLGQFAAAAVNRGTTSQTLGAGEVTVINGSAGALTMTLPASPQAGTINTILNPNNFTVIVTAGTGNTVADSTGATGSSYIIRANGYATFIYGPSTVWRMVDSNDATILSNVANVAVSAFGAADVNVAMGSNKITGLANGSAATDAAAFGQIPTALPPNGAASGDLSSTYPGPTVAKVNGVAISAAQATILSQFTGATTVSSTGNLLAGTMTVFTGTTAAQTLTLPASTTQNGTICQVGNVSTQSVTIAAGSGTTINVMGTTGNITLAVNGTVDLVLIGTVWYAIGTNDLTKGVGTLAVAHGGTGSTTAAQGSGGVVLATSPTITTPTLSGKSIIGNPVPSNNAIAAVANAATVPITSLLSTVTNNSAATLTITITTTSAVDGQLLYVRVVDFSAASQTLTWVNVDTTTPLTVTAPATTSGVVLAPRIVTFMYNSAATKWRCIASA